MLLTRTPHRGSPATTAPAPPAHEQDHEEAAVGIRPITAMAPMNPIRYPKNRAARSHIVPHPQMLGVGRQIHVDLRLRLHAAPARPGLRRGRHRLAARFVEQAQDHQTTPMVPTTSGTILALKSQRNAMRADARAA